MLDKENRQTQQQMAERLNVETPNHLWSSACHEKDPESRKLGSTSVDRQMEKKNKKKIRVPSFAFLAKKVANGMW